MNQKYKDWIKHVKNIKTEYEFGPIQSFKNPDGRLHRDVGPAYISPTCLIHYRDGNRHGLSVDIWGSKLYYFDDVMVPSYYITDPDKLTIEDVLNNPNAEVRAVGVRVYGFERMLQEERLKVLEIEKETGYMLLKWDGSDVDDAFCLVRVINSTPNPDGTRSIYYLTTPPDMKTVREAVAWTFYKDADEYVPAQET